MIINNLKKLGDLIFKIHFDQMSYFQILFNSREIGKWRGQSLMDFCWAPILFLMINNIQPITILVFFYNLCASLSRPAQLAELPRSKFDPKLFPHSVYVKIFVTFATKVPYLTFCDKM